MQIAILHSDIPGCTSCIETLFLEKRIMNECHEL